MGDISSLPPPPPGSAARVGSVSYAYSGVGRAYVGDSMSLNVSQSVVAEAGASEAEYKGAAEAEADLTFDGIQDGGFHEGYWRARYGQR